MTCMDATWESRWILGLDYRRIKVFFEDLLEAYQPNDAKTYLREPWDLGEMSHCIRGTRSGLQREEKQMQKLEIDP